MSPCQAARGQGQGEFLHAEQRPAVPSSSRAIPVTLREPGLHSKETLGAAGWRELGPGAPLARLAHRDPGAVGSGCPDPSDRTGGSGLHWLH